MGEGALPRFEDRARATAYTPRRGACGPPRRRVEDPPVLLPDLEAEAGGPVLAGDHHALHLERVPRPAPLAGDGGLEAGVAYRSHGVVAVLAERVGEGPHGLAR